MLVNCTHCSLITCCANWLSKFYSLLISSHSILNDFSFLSIHRAGLIWDFFLSRRLRCRDYYVHFYFCVLCILFFYIFILFQFFMVNRFDAIKPNKTILNAWLSNDSQLTNNHFKFRSNKIISVAEEWMEVPYAYLCARIAHIQIPIHCIRIWFSNDSFAVRYILNCTHKCVLIWLEEKLSLSFSYDVDAEAKWWWWCLFGLLAFFFIVFFNSCVRLSSHLLPKLSL